MLIRVFDDETCVRSMCDVIVWWLVHLLEKSLHFIDFV